MLLSLYERFSYAKFTRNQREKREKIKIAKNAKVAKGYSHSKPCRYLDEVYPKLLNACTLFVIFAGFSCFSIFRVFRVGFV